MLFLLVCDSITKCRPHEFPRTAFIIIIIIIVASIPTPKNSKSPSTSISGSWTLWPTERSRPPVSLLFSTFVLREVSYRRPPFKTFSCRPESHKVYSNFRPGPWKLIIGWRSHVSRTSCNWLKDGERAAECTLRVWRNLFCVHILRTWLAWRACQPQ